MDWSPCCGILLSCSMSVCFNHFNYRLTTNPLKKIDALLFRPLNVLESCQPKYLYNEGLNLSSSENSDSKSCTRGCTLKKENVHSGQLNPPYFNVIFVFQAAGPRRRRSSIDQAKGTRMNYNSKHTRIIVLSYDCGMSMATL